MAAFTHTEIMVATEAICLQQGKDTLCTGVSTDTRTIKTGDLFIALSGDNFDGHKFIAQAITKGASAIIVHHIEQLPEGITVYQTKNTLTALQKLAGYHRQKFSIPIIAITGSNGKTTTKDITANVLATHYRVLKTPANFNNEIGLSQTLLSLTEQHQVAVVEMGMRARGEIELLASIAKPTIGIITNVGETHMELLGSLENIAKAKAELVAALPTEGLAILNGDNPFVAAMKASAKCQIVFFGIKSAQDIYATNITTDQGHTIFTCVCPQMSFQAIIPLVGQHNVFNALAAVATGLELGLTATEMIAGLKTVSLTGMRQSIEKYQEYTFINDAYNASPMSMAAAIDTLVEMGKHRKIAVLGDMLELGDISVPAHRSIGQNLANQGIDVVLTLGELSNHIAQAAREYGMKDVLACSSHEQVQTELKKLLKAGDTVLLKGSRGMQMEKVLEAFK